MTTAGQCVPLVDKVIIGYMQSYKLIRKPLQKLFMTVNKQMVYIKAKAQTVVTSQYLLRLFAVTAKTGARQIFHSKCKSQFLGMVSQHFK